MKALLKFFLSETAEEIHANPESAQNQIETEEETQIVEEVDYSTFSETQLQKALVQLVQESNPSIAYINAKKIKAVIEHFTESQKADALHKFVTENGSEDDFEFHLNQEQKDAEQHFKVIRDRYTKFIGDLNQQKDANLSKKEAILETLRVLVSDEETNISFNKLKDLQADWKKTGPVPSEKNQVLWDNYHALINRFYDKKTIFDELKDLDRRKNLEIKLELCEKAEKIAGEGSLNKALTELNDLHQEFKAIGPVPKDQQEEIWNRFKIASNKIYDRKREYLNKREEQEKANEVSKLALLEKLNSYLDFQSDRIDDWNKKSDEIIAIRDEWNKIGYISKEKAKEVNRLFWTSFKQFFNGKKVFFKVVDAKRDANLKAKQELVEKVEALAALDEITEKHTDEVKNIQKSWKDIGAVPNKKSNEVFERFKKACDSFFEKKRGISNAKDDEFKGNLDLKVALCEKIETSKGGLDLDDIQNEWDKIGFVPRNDVNKIKNRFLEAVSKYLETNIKDEAERKRHQLIFEVSTYKGLPDAHLKIQKKEQALRNKIKDIENDIAVLANNMEFFSKSKNAATLLADFTTKIDASKDELKKLKEQLQIIRSAS